VTTGLARDPSTTMPYRPHRRTEPVIACPECSELAPPYGQGIMTDTDADGWRHAKICTICHGWGQVQRSCNGSAYRPAPFWVRSASPQRPAPCPEPDDPKPDDDLSLDHLWLGVLAAMDPSYPGWTAPPVDRPRVAWLALPAAPPAVRDFRGFLHDTLATWKLTELGDDAATVVSELATNALQHGTSPLPDDAGLPIDLYLSCGTRHLMTVVTDPCRRFATQPAMSDPGPFAETGRGLLIVDVLADAWGWARLPGGRTAVWALFTRR